MSALFRRHSNVQCFFCNSTIPIPQNPRNFRCSACGCWNRYNEKGEILSDDPAMHQEHLNRKSFAKRASPSKDQLPNLPRPGKFCHNCQTNQMLIMNLLSNYLPAPESSEYAYRVKMLPEYKESLYTRYPPVCESCQPAVEDEIHQKEQMARRKALGGWLKEGKERKRRVSGAPQSKEKVLVKTMYWKVRGALWLLCSVASITLLSMGMFGRRPLESVPRLRTALPFLVLLSLFWTAWDPTYLTIERARMQGRDVRLHGKRDYLICQMATWFSRLLMALAIVFHRRSSFLERYVISYPRFYFSLALMFELLALIAYPLCLRIQHPPPIRLIDTQSHRNTLSRSSTPATASQSSISTPTAPSYPKVLESDLLASLSLSSNPIVTPPKPVFGLPSLLSQTAGPSKIPAQEQPFDEDAMDWTPTNGDPSSGFGFKSKQKQNDADDASWLRPQRFFAPEKPTGLEGLFARTKLVDDDAMRVDDEPNPQSRFHGILKKWKQWTPILVIASCLPLAFYAGKVWFNRTSVDTSRFVTGTEL